MNLSEDIKNLRKKALLSQEEFAGILGVSLASVNRWEVGKSIPNITAMKAIKKYCEENSFPFSTIEEDWIKERE